LTSLVPSNYLVNIASLPWRSVFTVNFDTLFEKSLEANGVQVQVFTSADGIDAMNSNKRQVYKLHGSIERVGGDGRGLVITQDDLIRAESSQKALYRRLVDDIQDHEVVYVGFSLRDQDFRRVVAHVHDAVDNMQQLIPRGYAILPNPEPFARHFWDTKKISLIDSTLESFAEALVLLRSGTTGIQPIAVGANPRLPDSLSHLTPTSDLAMELSSAFEFLGFDGGDPQPKVFYQGGPPNWTAIRDYVDAPRDLADPILEEILISDEDEDGLKGSRATRFTLLTGYAGAGKTTLLKRIAWELNHTWGRMVVWTKNPSLLQLDLVEALVRSTKRRVYVFVDDAADLALQVLDVIRRSKKRSLSVSFVVGERENEWQESSRSNPLEPNRQYGLGKISQKEAEAIIQKLGRHGLEGTLKGLPFEEQVGRLLERAERVLLVGLREATEDGRRFDEIISDEYQRIPTLIARDAYLFVCTLFQFGVPIRAGILSRLTGVPIAELGPKILAPTAGVILGNQRTIAHQSLYTARHRIIADIVFSRALITKDDRVRQIILLLRQLDPGYRDDERAFMHLINARWLRLHGLTGQDAQEIYSQAKKLWPNNAFVVQQEALA
jgi:hypothetical protein